MCHCVVILLCGFSVVAEILFSLNMHNAGVCNDLCSNSATDQERLKLIPESQKPSNIASVSTVYSSVKTVCEEALIPVNCVTM